jgi:hypothetical protein
MRTQSIDTTPEIERIQIARIRSFSPARKFASVRSWTRTLTSANLRAMHNSNVETNERDIAIRFVTREYGERLAADLQANLHSRSDWTIQAPDLLAALVPVIEVFGRLGVKYALSGSVACSIYGFPRGVQDIDLVADLRDEYISSFVANMQHDYTLNDSDLHNAMQQKTIFNLLHANTLMKVDIFLAKNDYSFDSIVFERAQQHPLVEGFYPFWIAAPEDVALHSLMWYKAGGAVADDQWNDILGLFKVQALVLDLAYLQQQATLLQVAGLFAQALVDADISQT